METKSAKEHGGSGQFSIMDLRDMILANYAKNPRSAFEETFFQLLMGPFTLGNNPHVHTAMLWLILMIFNKGIKQWGNNSHTPNTLDPVGEWMERQMFFLEGSKMAEVELKYLLGKPEVASALLCLLTVIDSREILMSWPEDTKVA